MKRFIPLLVLFAAGVAASFALASPPGNGSGTTTHGNSGSHSQAKCHPVNLKGTVTGGTISVTVTKASGKNAQQLVGTTASLKVAGNVSVQAWSCAAASSSSGSAPATQTLFLKQLHVAGSPQNLGSTTTTSSP